MSGNSFFKRSSEGALMTPVSDLPPAKGKGLSLKQVGGYAAIATGLAACTTAVAAVATQNQASTAMPEATPVLPPTATPELPTPTPTSPPPVEGSITGLYYGLQERNGEKTIIGGIDGNKIETDLQAKGLNGYKVPIVDGAHEARINTYYYKDTPGQVSAFSSDNEYLMKYFKATIGKDGIKGQLPGGEVVEKIGNLWVTTATDGSQLVLNPLVMSRTGQLFGAPVILEKGGKVFLALVDANTGGLVTNPQDAFQTPAAVAAANGFKGPQAVGSVELTKSGLMIVKGVDGKFLAELNFSGRAITFEQWVQTSTPDTKLLQQAQAAYANAMGIDASKIETSVQMKVGVNGPFAVVVDKVTGMPFLVVKQSNSTEQPRWVEAIPGRGDIRIGVEGSLGDKNFSDNQNDPYAKTMRQFNIVTIAGSEPQWWVQFNPFSRFDKIVSGDTQDSLNTIRIQGVFYPGLDAYINPSGNQTTELVIDYSGQRIKTMQVRNVDDLRTYIHIRNGQILNNTSLQEGIKSGTKVEIVLTNEAINGSANWNDQYHAMKENLLPDGQWIVEAYTDFYNQALSLGMKPGIDFTIIGMNIPGIEAQGPTTDFAINKIISVKTRIVEKLNLEHKNDSGWVPLTIDSLPFDVGIQTHLGSVQGQRAVTLLTPFNIDAVSQNWKNIALQTHSRIHLTEVDALLSDPNSAQGMADVVTAAKESGVVDSITLWAAMQEKGHSAWWQNPIFNEDKNVLTTNGTFAPSKAYYDFLKALFTE